MRLISNRGNIDIWNPDLENTQEYIQTAINQGYEVKIDLWTKDNKLYLGTNEPTQPLDFDWFERNNGRLWIQCRTIDVMAQFNKLDSRGSNLHYFWHELNKISLTSRGYLWCESDKVVPGGIMYQPKEDNDLTEAYGICSDSILKYKK